MQPGFGPYAPPGFDGYPAPPKDNRRLWYTLGGVGLTFLALLVALAVWGLSLVDEEASSLLEKHPEVVKALGTGSHCSMDYSKSMADERYDYFYYACAGPKGKGMAIIHTESTGPNAEEELVEGTLEMPDGTSVELLHAQDF